MFALRNAFLVIIALASNLAVAGTMGPFCKPGKVLTPCNSSAWSFGGQALYLQPVLGRSDISNLTQTSQLYLNIDFGPPTVLQSSYFSYPTLSPNYNWGFKIEGAFHFDNGNDFTLNWYQINNGNHYGLINDNDVLYSPTGIVPVPVESSVVSIEPSWNAVNMEFAQHINVGLSKILRVYAGAQYARLALIRNFTGNPGRGRAYFQGYQTTYNGFGPRLGADLSYSFDKNIGIYGNLAGGLLAGTEHFSSITTGFNAGSQLVPVSNNLAYSNVVPELEVKLGVTYKSVVVDNEFKLDAGWMWINYFNAQAFQTAGVPYLPQKTDFGFQGPYIGLKWRSATFA